MPQTRKPKSPLPPGDHSEYITLTEAARRTGVKLPTLWDQTQSGEFPNHPVFNGSLFPDPVRDMSPVERRRQGLSVTFPANSNFVHHSIVDAVNSRKEAERRDGEDFYTTGEAYPILGFSARQGLLPYLRGVDSYPFKKEVQHGKNTTFLLEKNPIHPETGKPAPMKEVFDHWRGHPVFKQGASAKPLAEPVPKLNLFKPQAIIQASQEPSPSIGGPGLIHQITQLVGKISGDKALSERASLRQERKSLAPARLQRIKEVQSRLAGQGQDAEGVREPFDLTLGPKKLPSQENPATIIELEPDKERLLTPVPAVESLTGFPPDQVLAKVREAGYFGGIANFSSEAYSRLLDNHASHLGKDRVKKIKGKLAVGKSYAAYYAVHPNGSWLTIKDALDHPIDEITARLGSKPVPEPAAQREPDTIGFNHVISMVQGATPEAVPQATRDLEKVAKFYPDPQDVVSMTSKLRHATPADLAQILSLHANPKTGPTVKVLLDHTPSTGQNMSLFLQAAKSAIKSAQEARKRKRGFNV